MTNEEFIILNREKDTRSLALKKMPEGVDAIWCLKQIEGYQIAKRKLPRWAATDSLWYPQRLSMEQCSSENTAIYKKNIAKRLLQTIQDVQTVYNIESVFVDLTGGFGVDFSYMAPCFNTAYYIEQQQELCTIAAHNFPLLGLPHAKIINENSCAFLNNMSAAHIIYIDPARRNNAGKKTVAIEDCTPDISSLQDIIFSKSIYTIIKLSPMLDITQALRILKNVSEIHIVSVKGECKELLFVLHSKEPTSTSIPSACQQTCYPIYHCVNLATTQAPFTTADKATALDILPANISLKGLYLLEPNASILKAGVQHAFAQTFQLQKLHSMSNLFVSNTCPPSDIPARSFHIVDSSDFTKASLKKLLGNTKQGNLTIRNFPSTVAELRKRLKLKDGGQDYFFATTLSDNSHVLLKCISI